MWPDGSFLGFRSDQIPSQAFRAQDSSSIIGIPTRRDVKSGQRVVLWKDVERSFVGAQSIMNGQHAVLFLTDDDFQDLIPLRIPHHPGMVLEVAVGNQQTHHADMQTLDYLAQIRVRATLASFSQEQPIPRLFIVLPESTGAFDSKKETYSKHFRLYFLCECGARTTGNGNHKVHFTMHPGYDLLDSNAFFTNFGPYLLTMMYMAKYGIETGELTIPPMLGFRHANKIGMDQRRLDFMQKNIGRLIDDTISHLEEALGAFGADTSTTPYPSLSASGLTQLRHHLKIEDIEYFFGNLGRITTRDGGCAWICRDHWRESHEPALKQLKSVIRTFGGVSHKDRIELVALSDTIARQIYDALGEVSRTQKGNSWGALKESTEGIVGSFDGVESLRLTTERLVVDVKGFLQGEVKGVTIHLKQFDGLTLDDIEFIQHYHSDLTTREKALQLGHHLNLRSIEVVNGDESNDAVVTVSFSEESSAIESHVKLRDDFAFMNSDSLRTFIRQYGWTFKTIITSKLFNDGHAELLDKATQDRGSMITHLDITPTSLTFAGLDTMDRVIKRSHSSLSIRLFMDHLNEGNQETKALLLLGRYKDRINGLRLRGPHLLRWLPKIAMAFPIRNDFPILEELYVEHPYELVFDEWLSVIIQKWVSTMVAAPSQPLPRIKVLGILGIHLRLQDWKTLVTSLGLSTLEELHLDRAVYTQEQLTVLVDHIADNSRPASSLRFLDLRLAGVVPPDVHTEELCKKLREHVPRGLLSIPSKPITITWP
ncbi:hypothetical protein B0O80DRAFT_426406 [Mortierella sp. GBAus27b]|nr:hypothetical protein B0O80DRAFT_426406 [Mortierella sp. GBAus27b]